MTASGRDVCRLRDPECSCGHDTSAALARRATKVAPLQTGQEDATPSPYDGGVLDAESPIPEGRLTSGRSLDDAGPHHHGIRPWRAPRGARDSGARDGSGACGGRSRWWSLATTAALDPRVHARIRFRASRCGPVTTTPSARLEARGRPHRFPGPRHGAVPQVSRPLIGWSWPMPTTRCTLRCSSRDASSRAPRGSCMVRSRVALLNHQLVRADLVLCASERQRAFYLGQLAALGRISPVTYENDPALERLIAVAPFGLEATPPQAARPALRGVIPGVGDDARIVIWGGGVYSWFDPLLLIRAVHALSQRQPNTVLVFLGHPPPRPAAHGHRQGSDGFGARTRRPGSIRHLQRGMGAVRRAWRVPGRGGCRGIHPSCARGNRVLLPHPHSRLLVGGTAHGGHRRRHLRRPGARRATRRGRARGGSRGADGRPGKGVVRRGFCARRARTCCGRARALPMGDHARAVAAHGT